MGLWQKVPNVRQYYACLLCQILSDTRKFFWSQVVTGLLVGVFGVIGVLVGRKIGWIPKDGIGMTVIVSVLPYVVIVLLSLLWNAVRAPVKLENRRRGRIEVLRASAKRRTETMESLERRLADAQTKRHPPELERRVRDLLQACPDARAVLDLLMTQGDETEARLNQMAGAKGAIESGVVISTPTWHRAGVLHGPNMCSISEEYRPIVRDLLYGST